MVSQCCLRDRQNELQTFIPSGSACTFKGELDVYQGIHTIIRVFWGVVVYWIVW